MALSWRVLYLNSKLMVGSDKTELIFLIRKCDTLSYKCEVQIAVTQPDVEAN
jgi:hypothetical protein